MSVALNSSLDRDLGFDSLGRVELMLRVERAFGIRLPESLLAEAETPADLLRALLGSGRGAAQPKLQLTPLALAPVEPTPQDAATLIDVLEWHCQAHPERPHLLLDDGNATTATISFRALRDSARAVATGLRKRGVDPGRAVAIMLPTGADYFFAFFGILYAGCVPVPIYPPFRPSQLEDHLRRQAGIISNSGAAILLTDPAWLSVAKLLAGQVKGLCRAESVEALTGHMDDRALPAARAQDTALIQYTSGSTGDPKGVVLTHANLLANIRAIGEALEVKSSDIFVSWLPLYHDMGLIGAWLGSLYHAVPVAIMPPLRFLARPENWLWALHRYRATLSVAPNFAYELCLRKVDDAAIDSLDLSSLRRLLNGAEAVSPATLRDFTGRFARYGLAATVMAPVYGLAECAVGLAFPPPGRAPVIDRVRREPMTHHGHAVAAAVDDAAPLEFVACGHALPRHEIRIVDPTGRELEDRREGRLQFRGPSTTAGYFHNPAKTRELFDGEWLESGDLAYCADGDIFITGRSKDIIIRAGRHIYPDELEKAITDVPGVRKGCVVVFGATDPRAATERVVIVAETREQDSKAREGIRRHIDEVATALLEAPADDIVLAAPHTVLKTSSGKIRRAACRDLYEHGMKLARPPPVWRQILRLRLGVLGQRLARTGLVAAEQCYAAYWWSIVGLFAACVWLLVAALPTRGSRWWVIHAAARGCLWMLGLPVEVAGLDNLPSRGGVIVSNHSSYLDGVVLSAFLERPPVFVAKQELAHQFFAGIFLKRIETLFVDRRQAEKGAAAAAHAIAAARAAEVLVFFPEGTLRRMPGLLPFHMGPFLVAAAAEAPVVPVALHGTRSVLRGDQWFPRRGTLQLTVTPAIKADGTDWAAALAVRDAARARILKLVGEPDLADAQIDVSGTGTLPR